MGVSFESFVMTAGPRLRAGLVAAYGPVVGDDATATALAYGWEHWDRLSTMANPAGYLYRVGQTAARRSATLDARPGAVARRFLPVPEHVELPDFEPRLVPALEALSELQRICVVLVHGLGWPLVDTAELLDIDVSSVRTHIARALTKLHAALEVAPHV